MKQLRFYLLSLFLLGAGYASAQDAFDYAQKEYELTFTVRGKTQTVSCQAVRFHKNWFLTAAHCVSPCKNYSCQMRMWLAVGPARAAAVLSQKNVFLPEEYQDEYTLPPGVQPRRGELPAWDMALIYFNARQARYEYYDAYGKVKEKDFLLTLDRGFWEKKTDEALKESARLYEQSRQYAADGQAQIARQLTEQAQALEQDADEYRAAAEAAPLLKRQWNGAMAPRLAPLLTYSDKDEKFLLSNILVPRWTRGAFEMLSSPRQILYFGDNAAPWLSAGFGVEKGNSGGGVFLPVYNGGKKRASGLVGIVSAKSLNQLPEAARKRYALYGSEIFLFNGFSENTTLGFIRRVLTEYRDTPNVQPLESYGQIKEVVKKTAPKNAKKK